MAFVQEVQLSTAIAVLVAVGLALPCRGHAPVARRPPVEADSGGASGAARARRTHAVEGAD